MMSLTQRLRRVRRAALLACAWLASPAACAQVLLNVNSWVPPTHPLAASMADWCAAVDKAVAGRVTCSLLPKAAVRAPQTFDAVRDGLVDLAVTANSFTPGRFPLSGIAELPLLGDTAEANSIAYQRIYERALAKANEYKGVVVLAVFTQGPGEIYDTKLPVASLKDVESLRYLVDRGPAGELARAMGANPLRAAPREFSALLSSGFADGAFATKEGASSLDLVQHIRYATYVPGGVYNVGFVFMMNPRKWSRIAKADQDAIMALSGEAYARRAGQAWDAADAASDAAMRAAGIRVTTASPAFVAEIKARTAGLEAAWIDRARAKGIDAVATLNAFRADIAALSKKR